MNKIHLPHNHNHDTEHILEEMPSEISFEIVSDTFDLASDPTRLKILWLLCHSEECVANIAAVVGMSSPAVSHHLKILKKADILSYRKDGKEAYYSLASTEKANIIHTIIDILFDKNTIL